MHQSLVDDQAWSRKPIGHRAQGPIRRMKAVNGRRARGTQSNGRSSRLDKGRFKRQTGVELAKDQQSRTGVALETSNWTGLELEVHGKHRNLFAIEVPAFISPGVTPTILSSSFINLIQCSVWADLL